MSTLPRYSQADEDVKTRSPDIDRKTPSVHVFAETKDVYDEGESGVDPVYQAKARILNDAFQEIGMGRYQVRTESPSGLTTKLTLLRVVVSIYRHGVWLVLVSAEFNGYSCWLSHQVLQG